MLCMSCRLNDVQRPALSTLTGGDNFNVKNQRSRTHTKPSKCNYECLLKWVAVGLPGIKYLTGPSGYLVQVQVDNFTQNRTCDSLVFYPVFILRHLSSSMTWHSATFKKILFTKGGYKMHKTSFSFFWPTFMTLPWPPKLPNPVTSLPSSGLYTG